MAQVRSASAVSAGGKVLGLPAEDVGDLCGEGERIERLEQDCGNSETGEPALVYSLNLRS